VSSSACARRVSSNPILAQLSCRRCAEQYIGLESCRFLPAARGYRQNFLPDLRPMRPLLLSACALVSVTAPSGVKAQSMLDQMVIKKCSAAMQADFDKAGKTPPAGLIQQACSCVAQQLDATHNLEMAKTICTQQATAGI